MAASLIRRRWTLDVEASQVAVARSKVRQALLGAALDPRLAWVADWRDAVELAVSETVTNALVHAGTQVDLLLAIDAETIRVDVVDRSPVVPHVRPTAGAAISGRGLSLLAELTSRWGIDAHESSKSVWFELHREVGGSGDPIAADWAPAREIRDRATACPVVLRDVPLILHAAWQVQAASILRDYLLSCLEEDLGVLERHASVSAVLTLLSEQIPPSAIDVDLASLAELSVQSAKEMTATEIVLRVPTSLVESFDVMDELLDAAIWAAQSGAFATPPILAEVAEMRRWICAQVRSQAAGDKSATPWRLPTIGAEQNWSDEIGWPTDAVSSATGVRVAVSQDGVVLALSPTAAQLLNGLCPGGVLGQRFINLVPRSRRQVVLAAFTMQLAAERGMLVPLRLSDLGVEGRLRSYALTIESLGSATGQRVFVANLEPLAGAPA